MRRRLSQILTALLLLVGLMVGALWVRSYWRFDKVERWNMNHDTGFSVWSASSNYGLLTLSFTDNRGWIRSHRKIPDGCIGGSRQERQAWAIHHRGVSASASGVSTT
jgi:hypothetical protein